jgi:Ca2+-binding EF-hand superfamily protein
MRSLFALVLALGFAVPALAADDKPKDKPSPEEQFKKLDKNSDSKLSLEEFKGKRQGDKATKAEENFKKKDKDNDGSLTLEEYKGKQKKADK